jgi:hypothetical protein
MQQQQLYALRTLVSFSALNADSDTAQKKTKGLNIAG